MSSIVYDYIEDYIRSLIVKDEDILSNMEAYAKDNNVPIVQPETAKLLSFIIKSNGIKNILEIGTAIGYSASVMYKASGPDCRIVTIERDNKMISKANEYLKLGGFSSNVTILEGEADKILPEMEDSFDLIFLDGAKGQYLEFFPQCDRMLKNGGIIFADNVLFRGMVANNELLIRRKITIVKRMRKYLKYMSENKQYDTSILPLGDGVAISLKIGG